MIEKLADFPQNADTQKIIDKVNELVQAANKAFGASNVAVDKIVINHNDKAKVESTPKPKAKPRK